MGFGQLPTALFFADKVKLRETVSAGIEYNRILHFEQSLLPEAISGWECTLFTSTAFDHWWQEWSQHIFNVLVSVYCSSLDLDFQAALEVCLINYTLIFLSPQNRFTYINCLQDLASLNPPLVTYDIWCPNPRLGSDAPPLKDLLKKPALDLPEDQLIATLKRKQLAASQKATLKKTKVTPSK
jgi:hypothetical protein